MEKPILITASSLDEHAYASVATILEDRGYPVVVYKTDKVLSGEEDFNLTISSQGSLSVSYDQQNISPDAIGAAWYRKVAAFSTGDNSEDRAKHLYIQNEIKAVHDTVWSLYPDEVWLNSPDKMRQCDRKLGQLLVAQEIGFEIPHTVVSSNWDDISEQLLIDYPQMIVKMVRGVISEKDELRAMYTTVLNEQKVKTLKGHVTPFPGIYQPFIDKAREWRVTVVGDKVFPAAIYTSTSAKHDWRLHQLTDAVQFKQDELPDEIEEKCHRYLGKMGLKFGAFDFIETYAGQTIFLECNSNGQYGWLEDELKFPISEAIADELMTIAKTI
ncbi:MAG: hypothetical protein NVSMB46_01990 [Candidatus Saccharimonadales bacterium]